MGAWCPELSTTSEGSARAPLLLFLVPPGINYRYTATYVLVESHGASLKYAPPANALAWLALPVNSNLPRWRDRVHPPRRLPSRSLRFSPREGSPRCLEAVRLAEDSATNPGSVILFLLRCSALNLSDRALCFFVYTRVVGDAIYFQRRAEVERSPHFLLKYGCFENNTTGVSGEPIPVSIVCSRFAPLLIFPRRC